jgi:hypothetical protein
MEGPNSGCSNTQVNQKNIVGGSSVHYQKQGNRNSNGRVLLLD